MLRLLAVVERPSVQVKLWTVATAMWVLLTPVTMLSALAHSVPWLEFMSLFANSASCATALVAALAYVHAESANRKASHVIEHHPDLPPLP